MAPAGVEEGISGSPVAAGECEWPDLRPLLDALIRKSLGG